ncbi:hypothetical protein AMECASPLE_022609 [Ameca splendens]|uniref:Uncharacterized protein n=1 Tax=Ameca splendens TaxID=208324 RepID=A0ABV0YR74_9TELE
MDLLVVSPKNAHIVQPVSLDRRDTLSEIHRRQRTRNVLHETIFSEERKLHLSCMITDKISLVKQTNMWIRNLISKIVNNFLINFS